MNELRRAFGERVRSLRKARSVSGTELGKRLHCSQANISKIESGQIKPSSELVENLWKALKLSISERNELEALLSNYLYDFDRWSFEESDQYHLYQNSIGEREQLATTQEMFTWNAIPGLFQTEKYISDMHLPLNLGERRLREVVEARLKRQKILENRSKRFVFVLSEQSLYSRVNLAHDHIQQLKAFQEHLGSQHSNLSFYILPRDARLHLVPNVNFVIYDRKTVLVDEQFQSFTVWFEGLVEGYCTLFDHIREVSTHGLSAMKLLEQAIAHFHKF